MTERMLISITVPMLLDLTARMTLRKWKIIMKRFKRTSIGIILFGLAVMAISNLCLLSNILSLTLLLCGGFCLVFKKTVYENCRLKTTLISLCISLFGAIGLCCLFIWFSIVAFGKMSSHPIEYPVSIVGGLLSLFMFIIAIAFYIKLRLFNVFAPVNPY